MDYDKSLQNVIFDMLTESNYMFYGLFLSELNKQFSDKMPSAGVGKHPNSDTIQLYIGKDFWEKMCTSNSMRKGVLIHELEHIIREHIFEHVKNEYSDVFLSNMAQDIAINQDIKEELPKSDKEGQKCGAFIEDFPELNLERNQSSKYYYNVLVQAKERKEQSKGKEDSLSSREEEGNLKGSSGSKNLDEWLDMMDNNEARNWHESWDEISDNMNEKEMELLNKEMQETVKRVAEETEKFKGTVPSHISNAIKNNFGIKPPVISWKTLFNRFVGSTITTDIYQTRKRPNFRFEDAPSNKYKNKIRIVVGIDSSGSVSDHELEEFFGQIKHMYKAGVKIDVAIWDAHVHKEYEYKGENYFERVCQGGTHASSFIEYVNKHKRKKNWTCAINLTDGYIENDPIICNLPMLWLITRNGSISFNHKAKKIKMN